MPAADRTRVPADEQRLREIEQRVSDVAGSAATTELWVHSAQTLLYDLRDLLRVREQGAAELREALRAIAEGDVHGDTVYEDWFVALQVVEDAARAALEATEQ